MKTEYLETSFYIIPNKFNNTSFDEMRKDVDLEMTKISQTIASNFGFNSDTANHFQTIDFLCSTEQKDLIVLAVDIMECNRTSMRIKLDAFIWNGPSETTWENICTVKALFVSKKRKALHPHERNSKK
jgi:acyl-CoA hydrolase